MLAVTDGRLTVFRCARALLFVGISACSNIPPCVRIGERVSVQGSLGGERMGVRTSPRSYLANGPSQGILCALCRRSSTLTKAHVPPRCAGNRDQVTRTRSFIRDRTLQYDSPLEGGLWLKTICSQCNLLASRYDDAYRDFADVVLPHRPQHRLILPTIHGVPPIRVAPGRVARSVMHGMIAIAPMLATLYPDFLDDLQADCENIQLPDGLELRVAVTDDRYCRIASAYHMHRVISQRQDHDVLAEIYFRPLAWVLTGSRSARPHLGPRLVDSQRWGDATDWIRYSTSRWRGDLRLLLNSLPVTRHPARTRRDEWVELSGVGSYLLEGLQPA